MNILYASYNIYYNSIDIRFLDGNTLRLDCGKMEEKLRLTPASQNSLDALAIDDPMQYAVMAIEGSMQSWVDCEDNFLL